MQWNPVITEIVGGGVGALGTITDPIHIVANNLDTGVSVEASLLAFEMIADSVGTLSWDAGVFQTDHQELDFIMDIPSSHVAPGESGSIHLRIEQGMVTISDDTGIFDGMLPPAGVGVPLAFPFPNDFDLNYNMNLDPVFNWDVVADLSGGGGTRAIASCAADLNGDGALDIFDVFLFIELFNEGDLRADFFVDKIIDIFDVHAFIEVFVNGCNGADK